MSDRDALLAAIRAQPDEDTPRLVFADYLEENDELERAAFIRAQVELARTPAWEPFAVRCRWRPEVISAAQFLPLLPRVDGKNLSWPREPIRRGFGWELFVHNILLWPELAEPILAREPIGKIHFGYGALDDWRRVAVSEYVKHLRELVLNTNANEALFALRDQPNACGITDLYFQRASSPGMPEMLEEFFPSPLGRAIRGLHLHAGSQAIKEVIEAIHLGPQLQRLSFSVMGTTAALLRQLLAGPASALLEELHFTSESLRDIGVLVLAETVPATVRDLTLCYVEMRGAGLEALASSDRLPNLRRLNLRGHRFEPRAMKAFSQSHTLAGLRSLDLSHCFIGDKGVRHLTRAKFWPNLVEMILRDNDFSAVGVKHLLDAPIPPNLTALVLDSMLGTDSRAALTKKYGDAVIFAPSTLIA